MRLRPDHRASKLGPSRADQPVPAQDLATAKCERRPDHGRLARQIRNLEDRLHLGRVAHRQALNVLGAADHQRDQPIPIQVYDKRCASGVAAVAKDGHGVADFEHLFELVGHVENRHPPIAQPAEGAKQTLGFGQRDRGGGFVQQQDPGVRGKGAGDLDQLLLGSAERGHVARRPNAQADQVHVAARVALDLGLVDELRRLAHHAVEQHVLAHAEGGNQAALLVDDGNASGESLARARDGSRRALDQILPRVRRVDPGDDLHQSALARSVLAEERVDIAGIQGQRHVVKGADAGKRLADVLQLEQRRTGPVSRRIHRHAHNRRRSARSIRRRLTVRALSIPPADRMIAPWISLTQ